MAKRPNILLLTTDQQRWDTLHATGNEVIQTPNLDRLCRMGVAFTEAVTPVPVCSPARHRLFAGADSRTIGQVDSHLGWHPHVRPIQDVLFEHGYHTGGFGKMHFKGVRNGYGFMHFAQHEEMNFQKLGGLNCREDDDYAMYLKAHGYEHIRYPCGVRNLLQYEAQVSPIPEEHHETKWVADRAIDFIETFKEHPFFCYASWMQPHWPVHVPQPWADMYDPESIPLPVYDEAEIPHLPYQAAQQRRASGMFDDDQPPALARLQKSKARYYGSISFIDHQVGRILDTLETHGLLENTLIIFTSDHGEMLGDHQTFDKSLPYEAAVRIPFIVAGPGIEGAGRPSDEFVGLADIAPTVYEFAGIEPPKGCPLAGASLLGSREAIRRRDAMFFEYGEGPHKCSFIGLRTRKWKYAYYAAGGQRTLFDLEADPNELHDLLLEPDEFHQCIAAALHQRLLAWHAQHGVDTWIEDGDFVSVERPPVPPDRNAQYCEDYFDRLQAEEQARLWSHARSVFEVRKQDVDWNPAELDLAYWESKFGPGAIAELEELLGKKLL